MKSYSVLTHELNSSVLNKENIQCLYCKYNVKHTKNRPLSLRHNRGIIILNLWVIQKTILCLEVDHHINKNQINNYFTGCINWVYLLILDFLLKRWVRS